MFFHTLHVRTPRCCRPTALPTAFILVAIVAAASSAADTSPQLVTRFTRQVQPLILNKCAAGACHGGPAAHPPQFQRGDVAGRLNRGTTLANIESFTGAIGPHGDLSAFLATISRRHPAGAVTGGLQLAPLTPQERAVLEQWLVAATGKAGSAELHATKRDAQPTTTTATSSAKPSTVAPPNRFRAMLEAAAHPLPLPPPREPTGIILGKDRDE